MRRLISREWIEEKIKENPYWFLKIELAPNLFTPGWSDPATEKLPFYGLPDDMTGMRVLDIGCAEGFSLLKPNVVVLKTLWRSMALLRVLNDFKSVKPRLTQK